MVSGGAGWAMVMMLHTDRGCSMGLRTCLGTGMPSRVTRRGVLRLRLQLLLLQARHPGRHPGAAVRQAGRHDAQHALLLGLQAAEQVRAAAGPVPPRLAHNSSWSCCCGTTAVALPQLHWQCYINATHFKWPRGHSCLRRPSEPGAWYATLPLRTVFDFDPIPSGEEAARAIQRCAALTPSCAPHAGAGQCWHIVQSCRGCCALSAV